MPESKKTPEWVGTGIGVAALFLYLMYVVIGQVFPGLHLPYTTPADSKD